MLIASQNCAALYCTTALLIRCSVCGEFIPLKFFFCSHPLCSPPPLSPLERVVSASVYSVI